MEGAHDFLKALTAVLCVAAVVTVVFHRLRQPVVLGYILAGLIVGHHVPVPIVANQQIVQTLSELGVILLMFSLGLEFSLHKLVRVGPVALLTASIETSLMVWLGFMAGQALGFSPRESLFVGAFVAISSTTIIAKAFDELGVKGKLRDLVVGVLIVEDLVAIMLMALLTALSTGEGFSFQTVAHSSGRLFLFLIGLVSIGLLIVPRTIRSIKQLGRAETTLVASIGLCFAVSLIAKEFGYSVALGAFIAGSLVAESGEEKQIEHLIIPVRDMFGAIFFVSVGLLIDPAVIAQHWLEVLVLTVVVVLGKIVGVTVGAFLTGNGVRTSVQAGMSLAQIGEFSFIIAGLGISLNATRHFMYPVAVAVSCITALSTPWLIRAAGPAALFLDRKMPRRLQTFTTFYGSWVEQLRSSPKQQTATRTARRLLMRLCFDALLLAMLIVGTAVFAPAIVKFVSTAAGIAAPIAEWTIVIGTFLLAMPFIVGILRIARRLGVALAEMTLPSTSQSTLDLGAAPRRVLILTFQLAIVLVIGLPLLAATQPFLPLWTAVLVFGLMLLLLGLLFWKSTHNLHGHVRAGAEMIVELLKAQTGKRAATENDDILAPVKQLLPGFGDPTAFQLERTSAAVGRSLAELNLRGLTGASVLAIVREGTGAIIPTADEILLAGDVLALAGTNDAIDAAQQFLCTARS